MHQFLFMSSLKMQLHAELITVIHPWSKEVLDEFGKLYNRKWLCSNEVQMKSKSGNTTII